MRKKPTTRKVKGQAIRTARLLFGASGTRTMESPEEREHMALVLGNSHDARVQRLVTDLLAPDPDSKKSSLAWLAEKHGLNFHDISEEYKRLRVAEGYIRAAHKIPEIMQQVADDSLHRWEDCGACGGMGAIDGKGGVKKCSAKGCVDGKVYIRASPENIKLMFDTFNLTNKSGGVNVNLDLRKTDGHETLGDLANSLGPILEGNKP